MSTVNAQDKPAYQLYNREGESVSYHQWIDTLQQADVVLFGEQHNDPICHWLQLQVAKALYQQADSQLVLAAEMFEADVQLILDEYLSGVIQEKHLTSEARVWNNYATDYAPLVNFAKANQLDFIATNVPRRYASLVSRNGKSALAELSEAAQTHMAPLPLEVDMSQRGYQQMLEMMGGHGGHGSMGMKPEYFVEAQALKDATMAHFILQNLPESGVVLHFNGDFHSKNDEGIAWYLKANAPELNLATISTVSQEDISSLSEEYVGRADFILCIPADMTKTY